MKIGRFSMGIRQCRTKDFKLFYCPLSEGIGREKFHFFGGLGISGILHGVREVLKDDR